MFICFAIFYLTRIHVKVTTHAVLHVKVTTCKVTTCKGNYACSITVGGSETTKTSYWLNQDLHLHVHVHVFDVHRITVAYFTLFREAGLELELGLKTNLTI